MGTKSITAKSIKRTEPITKQRESQSNI